MKYLLHQNAIFELIVLLACLEQVYKN